MLRRLGGRRWQALHRLVYVSSLGGVLHYWWLVKADISSPQRYALIVGFLLLFRLMWARFRGAAPAAARPQALTRS
jgi:sulfoxide reductase heme-binding subunit YedZ